MSFFRMNRARAHVALLVIGAQLLANCKGDSPTGPSTSGPSVLSIGNKPADNVVLVNGTVTLSATAKNASGSTVSGPGVTWSSSNTGVATVNSSSGLVTGMSAGSSLITAMSGALSDTMTISVRVPFTTPTAGSTAPVVATPVTGVTVTIPPGAAPPSTQLTAAPVSGPPADDRAVPGSTFDFGPSGTVFATPITLALKFDPTAVPAAERSELRIYLVEPNGLTELPNGAVDLTTNTVTAPVSHFSRYTILRRSNPASITVNGGNLQIATAGTTLPIKPSVIVRDASGRPVPRVVARFAVSSGDGAIVGDPTGVTASNGVATLAGDWRLGATAGVQSLTVTLDGFSVPPVSFSATATTPATPVITLSSASVAFSGQASGSNPLPQTVDVTNSGSGTLSGLSVGTITYGGGASGWLTATLNTSTAPTTLTLAPAIAGLAQGSYTATVPVSSNVSGVAAKSVSVTLTVAGAVATQLIVAQTPGATQSGVVFSPQPVIEVRNSNGARVGTAANAVTASITSGTGTLLGTKTINAVGGVAAFTDLAIQGEGNFVLTFSAAGLTSTAASVTIASLAPHLVANPSARSFSATQSGTSPAAQAVAITSSSTAISGLAVGSITYGAGGTGWLAASLDATTTPATLTLTPTTGTLAAGTYNATVVVDGTGSSVSVGVTFTVSPLPATQVAITTQPAGAVSGKALTTQPVVEIRNTLGAKVAGAINSVTVALASGSGTLSGTTTVAAVNGVATFTDLRIDGAGAHTLSFTSNGLTSATSSSVTVTQNVASLAIVTQPAGAVSGSAFTTQPVVEIRDDAGLRISSATTAITAAKASGSGTLGGTLTVNAVAGRATFTDLAISGTGAHALSFSGGGASPVTSASFSVAAGAATQLAIATQPAGAVSGAALTTQPVIQVRDANGNVVVGSSVAVTAAIATGSGTLAGTTTVNAVNGVATFTNLRIDGAGAHTLTFTSNGLTSATSSSITVTQSIASLAIVTQPGGAVSGAAFTTQPVIEIRDGAGLRILSATNAITVAKASGAGTLGGTLTVNAVAGRATFTDLAITGTGAHTLSFSGGGASAVTSASFSVAAGPATQLAITTQPAGAVSGVAFATQPVIEIRDASGNVVVGSTVSVTAAIATGSGTLVGTATVNAVNGVATFSNLRIDGAGAHTITFASNGLTSATSSSITVTQTAASLAITTQPGGAADGVAFTTQPVVRILDNAGLLIANSTLAVTAAKASGSGTLGGTVTVNAVGGVATFAGLSISGSGAHTLSFATTTPSLTVTSASFTVAAGAPSIKLNVGAAATAAVTVGQDIVIPIQLDLSNRGTMDLASLSVAINWDPTKFTFKSSTAGNWTDGVSGDPASVTVNSSQTSSGTLSIAGFVNDGTTSSFTLRTITLTAIAGGSASVSANIGAAGNTAGAAITVTPRNLAVTINP